MRLLITGSRTWTSRYTIHGQLDQLAHQTGDNGLVVIHGDAAGVDRIARDWARNRKDEGFPVDEHAMPAKWRDCAPGCPPGHRPSRYGGGDYCPDAGKRRNAEMVALGPDLAAAFIRDCSPGASHCLRLIEAAGIPVVVWRQDGDGVPYRRKAASPVRP